VVLREDISRHVDLLQSNLEDDQDIAALMERLDKMIQVVRRLAAKWEHVDPATASRLRDREEQMHILLHQTQRLAATGSSEEALEILKLIRHGIAAIAELPPELRDDSGTTRSPRPPSTPR